MFCFTFVLDHNIDSLMLYFVQLENMYSYLNSSLKLSDISLISITYKVELIATEFFSNPATVWASKSCKSYLVGKYVLFRLLNCQFYA